MKSERAEATARKYVGALARGYEEKRVPQEKWKAEERVLTNMVSKLPLGLNVLDVPVGTGRFLPFYSMRQFTVTGLDISDDMLKEAELKGPFENTELSYGDIFNLKCPDRFFDLSISIRIMNLIGAEDLPSVFSELCRVTKSDIIFNLRVDENDGRFKNARDLSDIIKIVTPKGWGILENVEIHEPSFRMIRLHRSS